MVIDHICFAVKDIEESVVYWNNVFGYQRMTSTVINTHQKVKVTFLRKEGSITVKLIEPLPDNKSLLNFVAHNGGFHHLCFRCENINRTVTELTSKGLRLLAPPQPGEAFNNNNIAFLFASQGINIELIETGEKASVIADEGSA
ncbi:MAG TPA: VOC family protein [Bacteroidales bacterium]|jgi:methylmalonyl-CoA/ethylmalonyl-CoA epimerase|nr:VOC family protein [Bacteroidales bacterium]